MILVNNVAGAPGSFSYGGGTITVPVLAVSQPEGNALGAAVAAGPVSITVDPADAIALKNTMVVLVEPWADDRRQPGQARHRGPGCLAVG